MPKVQKLRKYRTAKQSSDQVMGVSAKTAQPEPANAAAAGSTQEHEVLSKGQKKRRQKRASLMVKMGMLEPDLKFTAASARREKKDAFNALLSELESTLPAASDVVRPAAGQVVKTNKLKKTLAVRETQRMKLVQQHPAFLESPLAAVTKHIQHMLAMKGAGAAAADK